MICGKPMVVKKKSSQKMCSVECQHEWQKKQVGTLNPKFKRIQVACENCSNVFYARQYTVKDGRRHFCSTACRQAWYSSVWSQQASWKEESRIRAAALLPKIVGVTGTKPQLIINSILDDMMIDYVNEYNCKYYSIDNYLPAYNLAIEVMGDFWHCNPLKYTDDSIRDIQRKRIPKDKAKHTYIKNKYRFEMLYLWEKDIYTNIDLCRLLIKEYLSSGGVLDNYHSFNYYIDCSGNLMLSNDIIVPYQDRDKKRFIYYLC